MNKRELGTVDELTDKIYQGLMVESTPWGEPQTFVDAIMYDDIDETMVSVRVTEEHEDLQPEDYYYRAEIIVSNNDDVFDDYTVLTSDGIGIENIRDLITSILATDFSSYMKAQIGEQKGESNDLLRME